jgi:hypothetical protein
VTPSPASSGSRRLRALAPCDRMTR